MFLTENNLPVDCEKLVLCFIIGPHVLRNARTNYAKFEKEQNANNTSNKKQSHIENNEEITVPYYQGDHISSEFAPVFLQNIMRIIFNVIAYHNEPTHILDHNCEVDE